MSEFKFKYIKDTKCPHCGAEVERYRNWAKWDERVDFKCGYSLKSKTPTVIEETSMCKNSKEWKKLVKARLEQLEKVKKFAIENVHDTKLFTEIADKLKQIDSDINYWWYD